MRFALFVLASAGFAALLSAAPANAEVKIKLEEVASGLTHPLAGLNPGRQRPQGRD
jgi:hypothetical protein